MMRLKLTELHRGMRCHTLHQTRVFEHTETVFDGKAVSSFLSEVFA